MVQWNWLTARRLAFPVCLIAVLALAIHYQSSWSATAKPLPSEDPTLVPRMLAYFQDPSKLIHLWTALLFGEGLAGSSFLIRYSLIAMATLVAAFIAQWHLLRTRRITEAILYVSAPFLIFAIAWTLLGMTVNGIAQAENFYWDSQTQTPGSFDAVTHAIAGGMIFAFLMMFDWSVIFGLYRERWTDVLLDLGMSFCILYAVAWYFEQMENLDPVAYSGGVNDTYADILLAFVGAAIVTVVYFLIWYLQNYKGLISEIRKILDRVISDDMDNRD